MRSALRPTTRATLPPPDQGSGVVITLEQVRPHPRQQNEYVDSPRGQPLGSLKAPASQGTVIIGGGTRDSPHSRVILPGRGVRALSTVISTQPPVSISPPLKKDPLIEEDDDSIICRKCGKCKCGACTEPRELPSRWLFGDKCQISADEVVETCTCFCCVKGVFYHCGKDEQDSDYVCDTDPCASCSKPHCCERWTCMAMMSLCLPCLCLYWPAKGVLKACTVCYNKCRKKGCQCSSKATKHSNEQSSQSQSRRLLIESDSSTGSS
ncbi:protein sprouty homolog 2-like [Mizuhopecten yessoensis]|uniref:Protein sprouty-like 2 n=1 Tax=Mizuhopecten yessoensis TaxID=6573 RepID=A0A210Q4Z1_MIZYE|nr:protein sprouty homolog 2-like [Mizuhopecten yessoensis]XP_021367019.1 protein sprouty homolog 2-like [Mizuhopecten yessoensis]OWF43781.1 Protein sprouty-like 2 [Mizuhopecten yessoensis]